MQQQDKSRVGRRTFLGESAGMVAGGLGCFGTLEGLRAAIAAAMAEQKPLLTEESLNAFLAEARPSRMRQAMAKEASVDLGGFLRKHFTVKDGCTRVLSELSREDAAKINQAIQEGFVGENALQVEIANVDLRNAPKPRVGVGRTTRSVVFDARGQTVGDDAQITTVTIGP